MSTTDRYGRTLYTAAQLSAFFDHISLPQADRDALLPPSASHAKTDLVNSAQAYTLLATLQRYTLAAVPFESLALHYSSHQTISIDPAALFHKIVERGSGRGGYCMENSCLFGTVLRSLGFDVYPTGARVNEAVQPMAARKHWEGPKYDGWNHMLNIVTIAKQKYFVDVGFGSSGPHEPIPLTDSYTTTIITQPVRLVRTALPDLLTTNNAVLKGETSVSPHSTSRTDQHLWVYSYRHSNSPAHDWLPAYCFGETEFTPADFTVMNHFTSTSCTSWFSHVVLCVKMLLADDGSKLIGDMTLLNNEVRRRIQGRSEVVAILENEAQRLAALREWFGVVLRADEVNGIKGMASELL